jgi:hypothetical protein
MGGGGKEGARGRREGRRDEEWEAGEDWETWTGRKEGQEVVATQYEAMKCGALVRV